jgi:hypothetical protein
MLLCEKMMLRPTAPLWEPLGKGGYVAVDPSQNRAQASQNTDSKKARLRPSTSLLLEGEENTKCMCIVLKSSSYIPGTEVTDLCLMSFKLKMFLHIIRFLHTLIATG